MAKREWFEIKDAADGAPMEIYIYGDIGESMWDDEAVSAKQLLDAINEAGDGDIDLHVNSCGGDVFDAFAMMTALKKHKGRVTCYVDGIAASAASYLTAAADEVVISSVAWLMIHNASNIVWGNAADMRECAANLDRIDAQIASIYAKRGSADVDFAALMAAETWIDADTAVEYGLADRVEEAVAAAAHVDTHSMRDLANIPDAVRAMVSEPEPEQPSEPAASDTGNTLTPDASGAAQEDGAVEPRQEPELVVIDGHLYHRN